MSGEVVKRNTAKDEFNAKWKKNGRDADALIEFGYKACANGQTLEQAISDYRDLQKGA